MLTFMKKIALLEQTGLPVICNPFQILWCIQFLDDVALYDK
jgi:hypothetical protein